MSGLPAARPEVLEFLAFLEKERNDSPHTVRAYGRDLRRFQGYADLACGSWTWDGVDRAVLRGFLGALRRDGQSNRSAARAVSALRAFYRFLGLRHGLTVNPARGVRLPKADRRLPAVLERRQADRLFELAAGAAERGGFGEARDLAMLELFYGTGMRLAELAGLSVGDVDAVADQVKVRGKGRKERILPVGRPALKALRRWEREREALLTRLPPGRGDRRALFLSRAGKRLTPRAIQLAVRRYLALVAERPGLKVHSLRHSFA
ncbi:MAG TPA: tyrosine-type recombinase/integrase, partial [Gemmatimonadales bacterium]|nr:tyrosine-type recombinase/integrase [Gemmatimonadales bacterium]